MNKQKNIQDNSIYDDYIKNIKDRKKEGLHPQPIDSAKLLKEIINHY